MINTRKMDEEQLQEEINELRKLLRIKEAKLSALRHKKQVEQDYGLNNEEVCRYSRQIFLPQFGVQGQAKIKNASVLIVGAGGLGCPAALYLACAGIGHIGIVDYDDIEISNLHRQILYTEANVGTAKVVAVAETLERLNSYVKVTPYKLQLDSNNALDVIKQYDVILDATDNVATRYLLNDVCVLSGKPLVSGSALRFEGHLTVFNYNGPCYRCVFPTPPPPESVTNCGDGGVLGAAVGTIGILQALEALKIILNMPGVLSERLLLFDGIETKFHNVFLRTKNPECAVCGRHPTIKKLIDYEQFCGAKANDKERNLKLLDTGERITVDEYNELLKDGQQPHVLIDVRSCEEYEVCKLKNSINVPFTEINDNDRLRLIIDEIKKVKEDSETVHVYVLCRRGNDSQKAVRHLQKALDMKDLNIKDIVGGIHAWSRKIDPSFPVY